MAGDWIKMRVGLTTHPKVMRIAERLTDNGDFCDWAGFHFHLPSFPQNEEFKAREELHNALRVTRYITVTALLKFWSYANEHAKGEFVPGIWPEDVNEITGVPGFADAIEACGWAVFSPNGGMQLPNFSEHNTAFLQRKSDGAERQKKYRERKKGSDVTKRDVTRDITRDDREEKRREESNTRTPALKKRSPIPKDFSVSESTREWASKNGFAKFLPAHLDYFKDYAASSGKTYVNWDAAFRNCIKGDWGGVRKNFKPDIFAGVV